MSSCNCVYTCCPKKSGVYTYKKYPTKTPQTNWYTTTEKPSFFTFKTNGSYLGRNRKY